MNLKIRHPKKASELWTRRASHLFILSLIGELSRDDQDQFKGA